MFELITNKSGSITRLHFTSRVDIVRWMSGQHNPAEFGLVVFDDAGMQVGAKPLGQTTITWKSRTVESEFARESADLEKSLYGHGGYC